MFTVQIKTTDDGRKYVFVSDGHRVVYEAPDYIETYQRAKIIAQNENLAARRVKAAA